jgi:hypothetical protein
MPTPFSRICAVLFTAVFAHLGLAQSLPTTAGETLSGRPIVLAQAVRGHEAVLVAGFSREGGSGTGAWMKALDADSAAAGVQAYQIAMLAAAPSFFRGMIRNGMKRGVSPSDQDRFVVLTTDEQSWRNFFGVTTDSDPYVVLLNAQGKVVWRGHGAAAQFEAQLKSALR